MISKKKNISSFFVNNRAEEAPDDLWGRFVIPTNYEQFNILEYNNSIVIESGRGTGKTSYIKYHCYPTMLSQARDSIAYDDVLKIGIHWRPDTVFTRLITKNQLDDKSQAVFKTYVAISLLVKFIDFIKIFSKSNYQDEKAKATILTKKVPSALLKILNIHEKIEYVKLTNRCNELEFELQNWINWPLGDPPIILDGKSVINLVIKDLKNFETFKESNFYIFIDEFENLTEEQQKIINTWMKHSEKPLIFNVAYKKYSNVTDKTTGDETLHPRDDYRKIDLIEDVYKHDFQIMVGEIVLNKIDECLGTENINKNSISDQKNIESRKNKKYKDNIKDKINFIFPSISYEDICSDMLKDKTLLNTIRKKIKKSLQQKSSKLKEEQFYSLDAPRASIVNVILLYRKKTLPDELLSRFNNLKNNETDDSENLLKYKELINHNVVAAILYIYSSHQNRICPIYSGYEIFHLMSHYNIRHFLELCYQSFLYCEKDGYCKYDELDKLPKIPIESQLNAAKFCSQQEIDRITELGPYGEKLQKIIKRIGDILTLAQKRDSQSKPEITHFTIEAHSIKDIKEREIERLISEAKLWGLIKEEKVTKDQKDSIEMNDYIPSPIFAPYFMISSRKIHKIAFKVEEIKTIFLENDESFSELYRKFAKASEVDESSSPIKKDNLF